MASHQTASDREIFQRAVALPPRERAAYLDCACGEDTELRREVESLLQAHVEAGQFMDRPAVDRSGDSNVLTAGYQLLSERPGTVIGPYKLMEQIGEGGFGLVFVAEQHRPVRRKVALKIIKPGMDTRDVIARFEAERQALALMDHPNIAKVFDAGTTDTGRPYFVMELVRGVPITDYCDQHHLTPRERLELFVSVCHAIQHAHQKGIIHRDVKPTNVLVTPHDGRPVVKVIDFGVAKALSQQLTERTIYTQFAQMIGTPLYMSPEQAEMSGLDIDTRSDIYSLGVLLYELLTGTTPFDRQRLRRASAEEIRRILREEDPPRPSTRISQSGDRLPSIAAQGNTDPAKLTRLVRGDLDWIVMKCLEKDRNRRYETANGLARDIERYLHDEPVTARPPSAIYRFRKFAGRNKVALLAASAVITTLLLVVVGLVVSNRLIAAERNEKAAALQEREAAYEEVDAQRQRAERNFLRARMAITGILARAATGQGEWSQLTPPLRRKFTNETVKFYESLLQEESADPKLRYETAVGYRSLGSLHNSVKEFEQAEKLVRQSIGILEELVVEYPETVEYRHQLAWSHFVLGSTLYRGTRRLDEAEAVLQKAAMLYEELIAQESEVTMYIPELRRCYADLIELQHGQGDSQAVEQSARRLVVLLAKIPPTAPTADAIRANIVASLLKAGRFEEASVAYSRLLESEPEDPLTLNHVAWFLANCQHARLRDPQRAVELASKAAKLAPSEGHVLNTLGVAQYRLGDWQAAITTLNRSMKLRHGGDSFDWLFLAMAEWRLGNQDAARRWYDKAVEWIDQNAPQDEELVRFRAEAEELLGVTEDSFEQSAPPSDSSPAGDDQ